MVMKMVRVIVGCANLTLALYGICLEFYFLAVLPAFLVILKNVYLYFDFTMPPSALLITISIAALICSLPLLFCVCVMIISAVYFFKTAFRGTYTARKKYALLISLIVTLAFCFYMLLVLEPAWFKKPIAYSCLILSIDTVLLFFDWLSHGLREKE